MVISNHTFFTCIIFHKCKCGDCVIIHICCRRQHTILNMKYRVYLCPVSLPKLCIVEIDLDFVSVGKDVVIPGK